MKEKLTQLLVTLPEKSYVCVRKLEKVHNSLSSPDLFESTEYGVYVLLPPKTGEKQTAGELYLGESLDAAFELAIKSVKPIE